MNMFNDPINYTLSNFSDVARLNKHIFDTAVKFDWLNPSKLPENVSLNSIFKSFKHNLEKLRDFLVKVEEKLAEMKGLKPELDVFKREADEIKKKEIELKKQEEELDKDVLALRAKVSAYDSKVPRSSQIYSHF